VPGNLANIFAILVVSSTHMHRWHCFLVALILGSGFIKILFVKLAPLQSQTLKKLIDAVQTKTSQRTDESSQLL